MSTKEQYLSNVLYFEGSSMRELYNCLEAWQVEKGICFRSLNIEQDDGNFCCIALIHPADLKQKIVESEYEEAMARFQRKAIRVIVKEKNIGAIVDFVHPIIPGQKILAIQKRLMECTSALEIGRVFEEEY